MSEDGPSWSEIESLYHRLWELDEKERRRQLGQLAKDDPELARRVADLIAASRDEAEDDLFAPGGALRDGLWEQVSAGLETSSANLSQLHAGERVGPYRIVEELGRGGMATVYRAERDDPDLPQQVALKLVTGFGDPAPLVERFTRERRILASLDHPNIARFLDAGVTDQGRPFLALELVAGPPIHDYCDQAELRLEERVELFLTVAEAVSSAHQKLIVHRDLKPSNILVDGEGRPKLLDFGIAKLLAGPEDEQPTLTRTHHRLLTPEYATPEQIRGQPATTATDVYQLGLLLYELLSGCRAHRLEDGSLLTLERAVLEGSTPPPSVAVARLPREEAERVATARGITLQKLERTLRGDLDNIVLKAIATEPEERYGSVARLLDDLERWRAGAPVSARAATPLYRAGKFLSRHRFGVGAAGLILLSLIAGLVATLWQARAAERERDRALRAAQRAEQVSELLIGVFEASDPEIAQGEETSARELLDRGLRRVESELAGNDALRAEMQGVLGRVYLGLGRHLEAEALLRRAIEQLRPDDPADRPTDPALLAANLDRLAEVRLEQDDDEEAESLLLEALALRERWLGAEPLAVAESRGRLGFLHQWRGELDKAESSFRSALGLRRNALGDEHADTAESEADLGWVLYQKRDFEQAEELLRSSFEVRRRTLGERHPSLASSLDRLAAIESVNGRAESAEDLYRRSLDLVREVFGADHPRTLLQENNLAQMMIRRGAFAEAEARLRDTEAAIAEHLGGSHPYRATALMNLGVSLRRQERYSEAIAVLQEATEIRRSIRDRPDAGSAMTLYTLGLAQRDGGLLPEAADSFTEALRLYRVLETSDSPALGNALVNAGDVLAALGRTEEAEELILEGLRIRTDAFGESHWITDITRSTLGGLRAAQGRREEAEELLESSLRALREKMPDHYATRQAQERWDRFRDDS